MEQSSRDALLADVHGRSIVSLIRSLVHFWGLHSGSLSPLLPAGAVSALNALVAAYDAIAAINPPGPQ